MKLTTKLRSTLNKYLMQYWELIKHSCQGSPDSESDNYQSSLQKKREKKPRYIHGSRETAEILLQEETDETTNARTRFFHKFSCYQVQLCLVFEYLFRYLFLQLLNKQKGIILLTHWNKAIYFENKQASKQKLSGQMSSASVTTLSGK